MSRANWSRPILHGVGILIVIASTGSAWAAPDWVRDCIARDRDRVTADDADAIVLLYEHSSKIESSRRFRDRIRRVVEVVRGDGGIDARLLEMVNPSIRVRKIKGWHIPASGKEESLKEEWITKFAIDREAPTYSEDRLLAASFPHVAPGSIVAFEYEIQQRHLSANYQRFNIQGAEPVVELRIGVEVPDGWTLRSTTRRATDLLFFDTVKNRYSWAAWNLPGQVQEPLSPDAQFLRRLLYIVACPAADLVASQGESDHFYDGTEPDEYGFRKRNDAENAFITWKDVARWSARPQDPSAEPDSLITARALEITRGLTTDEERVRALAHFVRDRIRYVAVEIGAGRFVPRPAARTLRNGYGDCKDKTALLRAMLRSIEIPSRAALVCASWYINAALPSPVQFDHCILALPDGDEDWRYYDPTDPSTEFGQLPRPLLGGLALVADSTETGLQLLPTLRPEEIARRLEGEATLGRNGAMEATFCVSSFGTLAAERRHEMRNSVEFVQVREWQQRLAAYLGRVSIRDYETIDSGNAITESFRVEVPAYARRAGDLTLFRPDPFHTAEPPVVVTADRENPIHFGTRGVEEIVIDWHLPEGMVPESRDLHQSASCRVAWIEADACYEGGRLRYYARNTDTGFLMTAAEAVEARRYEIERSRIRGWSLVLEDRSDGR
jgi:transglutaminase-like putative cysteine protease